MMREKVLEISGLKTWFHTPEGVARSVDGESFTLRQGETLALVGGKRKREIRHRFIADAPAG